MINFEENILNCYFIFVKSIDFNITSSSKEVNKILLL